jgi:hypothetical protein
MNKIKFWTKKIKLEVSKSNSKKSRQATIKFKKNIKAYFDIKKKRRFMNNTLIKKNCIFYPLSTMIPFFLNNNFKIFITKSSINPMLVMFLNIAITQKKKRLGMWAYQPRPNMSRPQQK